MSSTNEHISQPLLDDAEQLILSEDHHDDEIEESKREIQQQQQQSAVVQLNEENETGLSIGNSLSYLMTGYLCVITVLLLAQFVLATVSTTIDWFKVVLRVYTSDNSSSHREIVLMEDRMMDFLRYWYNSDAGNFWSFLMTVFTLTIPFMRVSLQCCTVIIILQIVLFGDSYLPSNYGRINNAGGDGSDGNANSCSGSWWAWSNIRWSILRGQAFFVSPLFGKTTGTSIYVGAFVLVVATVELKTSDGSVFKVAIPFEEGGMLFYASQLCSQLAAVFLMLKLEKIFSVRSKSSRSSNDELKVIGEDEFIEYHDEATCVTEEVASQDENRGGEKEEYFHTLDGKYKEQGKLYRNITNLLAVISFVTGVMVWFFPLMKIEYSGLEASFFDEDDISEEYTFWSIIYESYKAIDDEMNAGALFALFLFEAVILPPVVLGLSLALHETRHSSETRELLVRTILYLRVFMNIESFYAGVIIFVASIEPVANYLFNDFDLCEELNEKSDENCLLLNCKIMAGTWILTAYTLSLVAFNAIVVPLPAA